ncbi:UDP-glucose/GDP-mannose dehydrogenase family protein [Acidimicrobiaceae bacterium]|nr:UDP-glucose/GDP-mannose dehydrogenase family protein [Acidimicrobiaceae bacterium]
MEENEDQGHIAVIGCGYVGLTMAASLANLGHSVIGVESSLERLESLQEGEVPFFEPGLEDLVNLGLEENRLVFTSDLKSAVSQVQFVFVCVPTPSQDDGSADLSVVRSVSKEMSDSLISGSIVILKSTVPIGTSIQVDEWIGRNDVEVASNPEFLQAGRAVAAFENPDRIIIGANTLATREKVAELYVKVSAPVVCTDSRSAELIKYASNAYLASRITFVNNIAELCEKTGGEASNVLRGLGLDNRIGEAFLQPGPGWGGSCFPKDTRALISVAAEAGSDAALLNAVLESNEKRFAQIAAVISQSFTGHEEIQIAMLGLTFKAGTDDLRESPSLKVASLLLNSGVKIVGYDPQIITTPLKGLEVVQSVEEAVKDSDALVVMTEWERFIDLDPEELIKLMKGKTLVDTRAILNSKNYIDAGFSVWQAGHGWKNPQK